MLASAQAVDRIAALIDAIPAYGDKVFTSRAYPLTEAGLPAWKVYAEDEEVEPTGPNFPALQMHTLEVVADGYAKATADLDDAIHAMGASALTALFASKDTSRLSPLNCSMSLTRIERELSPDGQASLGRISIRLRVKFHTMSNAPETIT
jgi:hypothetical protein